MSCVIILRGSPNIHHFHWLSNKITSYQCQFFRIFFVCWKMSHWKSLVSLGRLCRLPLWIDTMTDTSYHPQNNTAHMKKRAFPVGYIPQHQRKFWRHSRGFDPHLLTDSMTSLNTSSYVCLKFQTDVTGNYNNSNTDWTACSCNRHYNNCLTAGRIFNVEISIFYTRV